MSTATEVLLLPTTVPRPASCSGKLAGRALSDALIDAHLGLQVDVPG